VSTGYPNVRAVSKPAGTDQVLVGGVDITWLRATRPDDQPTRVPSYQLLEPLAYGPSDPLIIPRTNSAFERAGQGDLACLKKGAEVLYRRLDEDGNLIATDYRGVVLAIRANGRNFALDVGGQVEGRAELIYRPNPKVRHVVDAGHWVQLALSDLNIPITPPLGPVTGFLLTDRGDMTLGAWLLHCCQYAQNRNGLQYTLMPQTWGGTRWEFRHKDTTTVDMTIYADGDRIELNLVDDATEQPNTYFGTGIDPDGTRWDGSGYPGFFSVKDIPDYPVTDDSTPTGTPLNFGIGTTDADTVHGDGITELRIKLLSMGYLDLGEATTVYNQAMYDAVHELKKDADLSDNGTMTPAAWDALWDVSVTGFSNVGAGCYPILQDSNVRKWKYSATKSIIGRNDNYDPTVLRVDVKEDFGPGVSKQAAIDNIRARRSRAGSKNWAGTITLNSVGAFTGQHDDTDWDTLTGDDLMPLVDIRPGMNAWLPYFDGGTLVHIADARVNRDTNGVATSAVLHVDTQARDALTLREIIERNRDSRRDPRREWLASNQATKPSGNVPARDEWFGKLDRNAHLIGGRWNTIYIITGYSGTVNRTHLVTINDPAEFCFAVFSGNVTEAQLQHRLGNPFPVDPVTGETVWDDTALDDWFEDKILRYAFGNEKQPGGYGRRKKYGNNGHRTTAPLTGTYIDDSSWTYLSTGDRRPFITLAIYPDRDCILRRGQVFDALVDDVI
jgi:hypothetical protein